jgi:probable F420-dependent oxidoreductase
VLVGVALGGDLRELGDLARRAEDAGFESVWCAETARTGFLQAAVAIAATSRVSVGTAISLAFPRSPAITAMSARDLAELSGGRFQLGLGSQVKRVNEQRFSVPFEHPAPRMEDYVHAVRAVLDGFGTGAVDHRGPFYSLTMPPFPGAGPAPGGAVPIHVAAVNRGMAEAAGRAADGVIGHPMTSPAWVERVLRPAVEHGAGEAGRPAGAVAVTTNLIVQVSADRDEALREAAGQVAFYATTRTYRPVLELHDFADLQDPIRRAFARGDHDEMVRLALPMAGTLAVAGTAAECRERIDAYRDVADRVILGGAWVGPSPERIEANQRSIIESLGPA